MSRRLRLKRRQYRSKIESPLLHVCVEERVG